MLNATLRIRDLIKKHHIGEITADEAAELEAWRSANLRNERTFEKLTDPQFLKERIRHRYSFVASAEEALQKIMNGGAKAKVIGLGWRRIISAAAAIIVVAVSVYLWDYLTPPNKNKEIVQAPINADVDKLPGYNNAILTLSNGQIVDLKKAKPGLIAQQGASSVTKTEDGKVIYVTGKSHGVLKFNTLETPPGGHYPIVLEDGTKIFMNSVSRLDFPEKFPSDKRVVRFSGEAYFEVHKDNLRPFYVIINGQQIQVTGTKFTVNSYSDERYAVTTLVEGGIKMSRTAQDRFAAEPTIDQDPKSVVVKPGQAVIYDTVRKGQKLEKNADIEASLAFVNGQFVVNGNGLPSIMRQLSRWYNVQIQYEKGFNPDDIVISGTFDKNQKLSQVIKILKELGVRARLEGNKLIVGAL